MRVFETKTVYSAYFLPVLFSGICLRVFANVFGHGTVVLEQSGTSEGVLAR